MTKANKAIFWSLVVCVMALVVGLCFVGTTFARYTSSGSGEGEVYVATWDVAVTPSATFDATLTASPDDTKYQGDSYSSDYARSNQSPAQLAAKITNTGSVDALVTAKLDEEAGLTFNWYNETEEAEGSYKGGYDATSDATAIAAYKADAENHFSIELWKDANGSEQLSEDGEKVVATTGSLDIYADVLWTTDTGDSCFGEDADAFDTFCGFNLVSISFTINFTAVQASAN